MQDVSVVACRSRNVSLATAATFVSEQLQTPHITRKCLILRHLGTAALTAAVEAVGVSWAGVY